MVVVLRERKRYLNQVCVSMTCLAPRFALFLDNECPESRATGGGGGGGKGGYVVGAWTKDVLCSTPLL